MDFYLGTCTPQDREAKRQEDQKKSEELLKFVLAEKEDRLKAREESKNRKKSKDKDGSHRMDLDCATIGKKSREI